MNVEDYSNEERALLAALAPIKAGVVEVMVQNGLPVIVKLPAGDVHLTGATDLLDFLHGLEWGHARVQIENGRPVGIWQAEKRVHLDAKPTNR
jgi:hypothetical protein